MMSDQLKTWRLPKPLATLAAMGLFIASAGASCQRPLFTNPFSAPTPSAPQVLFEGASRDQIIAAVNQQLARYETIKRHTLLAQDFTLESGELTPTQKVKRNVVTKNYASVIESMYAEAASAQAAS